MKVLFVCLGNICRSPMAEGIFNKLVKERGLGQKYTSDSAGTAGYHIGELPDFRTRKICEVNATPLNHRGRKLLKEDINTFDLILAMDLMNYKDILEQLLVSDSEKSKVRIMRSYEPDGYGKEVPDPYYGDLEDFKLVYSMLENACTCMLDELELNSIE
ncbi:MAG: low molecular weight phosphotyrosine protein phosphatase [Opitutaceae bacterium]|nr:low molecular weight phosphotyrosine protein phosphatase [Cytophagales bacterium]